MPRHTACLQGGGGSRGYSRPDKRMMTFYVMRHGETELNRAGVFQGHMDVPLSDKGRRQAELLGEALAGVRFDAVYSSDLSRAADTARAIMKHQSCTLILDRRLRELHGARSQGLAPHEMAEKYPEFDKAFRLDPVNTRWPGGESFADLQERVARAIDDIYEWNAQRPGGGIVAVVGHGGVVRCILRQAYVDDLLMEQVVGNCTITVLQRDGNTWTVLRLDDGEHLKALDLAEEDEP